MHACLQRNNDTIVSQVRLRVEGALSDLHAADARYHVNCMTCFMSPKSISAAKNSTNVDEPVDLAFDQVMDEMKKDKSRLWNTSELSNTSYLGVKT